MRKLTKNLRAIVATVATALLLNSAPMPTMAATNPDSVQEVTVDQEVPAEEEQILTAEAADRQASVKKQGSSKKIFFRNVKKDGDLYIRFSPDFRFYRDSVWISNMRTNAFQEGPRTLKIEGVKIGTSKIYAGLYKIGRAHV